MDPRSYRSACSLFVSQGRIDVGISHTCFHKFNTRQLFHPFVNSSVVSIIRIRLAFSFALIWFLLRLQKQTRETPNCKFDWPPSFRRLKVTQNFKPWCPLTCLGVRAWCLGVRAWCLGVSAWSSRFWATLVLVSDLDMALLSPWRQACYSDPCPP